MKLLLVNPRFNGAVPVPSFGLGFIGSYVREKSDCSVEIVDQNLDAVTDAELLEKARGSDIVGMVCYTESRFEVFSFAAKAKKVNPDCKVLVGGAHVQTLDRLTLKHYPQVDIVVRMEGEETVLDIVKGKPYADIPGITWRDAKGEAVRNQDRTMMENLDILPFDYALISKQIKGWKDPEIPLELQKLNALPIIVSRGCPFQCKFCAANRQWGSTYRFMSAEELVRRIQYFVSEHNIGYFRFYDALFLGSEARLLKFCDLLEESKLKISFRVDVRVGTSEKILRRLREVGCEVLGFGIESGSDKVLKRMRKGITRKQIEQTIKITKSLGYWNIGFFMVSMPDETYDDIKATFELLNDFDEMNVQFFKVHPNTVVYDELKEQGEIDDEVWFDPSKETELFYCRERFRSAMLPFNEANALVRYAYNKAAVGSPRKLLKSHGTLKGGFLLSAFLLENILLRSRAGRALHGRLRNIRALRGLMKRLTEPKT